MRSESEIKARLKTAKATYNDRRMTLRIATGTVEGDRGLREVLINQLFELAVEIETLEWVFSLAQPGEPKGEGEGR